MARADAWADQIRDPTGAYRVVAEMVSDLAAMAEVCDNAEWGLLRSALLAHPLSQLLRRDPLLARAWRRCDALGQMGVGQQDAVLVDLMLRHPESEVLLRRADDIGRNVYEATSALPGCEAMRDCRRLLARLGDSVAERRWGAEILGIGPAYMREAALSLSGPAGGIRRWVGLVPYQDDATVIARSMPVPWVIPYVARTLPTLLRPDLLGSFDLVYCTGLDQLPDQSAELLMVAAFARVRPGGRLLLAGHDGGGGDAAFWRLAAATVLHQRDEARFAGLAAALPPRDIAARRVFRSINDAMVYLEVEKA
ncbi:hypothetical protein [Elioraea sp.]|uniref:hypothetical protein n=1 Tax=Elioraea sp. TaxID=2185103 RepID=UPI0025C39253|nr:hypothetical protein [Elioraea sp.]